MVNLFIWNIPAAFFDRFFPVEFLVELDVTSTGLFSTCARFLFPVLLCWGEFCCVVLHCAVNCVAIRCVTFAFCCNSFVCCVACVVLCCDPLRCVALRCILLCCDPLRCVTFAFCCNSLCCICCVALRCVVIRCVVLFTSSAFLVFRLCWSCTSRQTRPTSLTGRQSLHQRTRQTQPPLANLINSTIFTYFKTVRIPQCHQLDKLNKPHSLTDKISTPRHNWTNTTTLTKQTNLTIHPYFKTVQTRQRDQLDKIDKSSCADAD